MEQLENYYSGDADWKEFSSLFDEQWISSDFQNSLLLKLDNKTDLAKVIYHHFLESSLKWINRKVPALNGLTPLECIQNEDTEMRLRECLMRMP